MRTVSWLFRKLWLTLAVVLVLVAVGLSLLRYSLPYLPDLTAPLEDQLEARFQQPVSISDLSMAWTREGPSIVLKDLILLERDESPVQVRIGELHVVLDFWKTLLDQQLVAQQFILDDARIAVDMRQLSVKGDSDRLDVDAINRLFLQQLEKFSLNHGELLLTNLRGVTRKIDIERLSWVNQGKTHQGVGQFRMEDFATNSLDFVVDLHGDRWSEFNGQFYVDSQQVDISPWLEEQLGNVDVQASNVNFTGWLDVRKGQLFEGLLKLRDNRITWLDKGSDTVHWLQLAEGKIILRPEGSGWLLNSLPMQLNTSEGAFNLPRVAWQQQDGVHDVSVANVAVNQLASLLPLLPSDIQPSMGDMTGIGLSGAASMQYRLHPLSGAQWTVQSDNLAADGNATWPSFNGLALSVKHAANQGMWHIDGHDVRLSGPQLSAEKAWDIDTFQLRGTWFTKDDHWTVRLDQMNIRQDDFHLTGEGRLNAYDEDVPQLDVKLQTTQPFSIDTARQLLPSVMGENVKHYLTESLMSGQAVGFEALWRGPVNAFPDDRRQGVFNARVSLRDVTYRFQPDWPALTDTDIELDFYNKSLTMASNRGQLDEVSVERVDAQIPDLTNGERGLDIQAQVSGDAGALLPIFEQSPLSSVSETLRQLSPQGRVSGRFQLGIPLTNGSDVSVAVQAPLSGLRIDVDAIQQPFEITAGTLNIDNSNVSTDGLQLTWYGMPLTTTVSGALHDEAYQLNIDTRMDWQSEPLFEQLPYPEWEPFFYGAVNGEATLQLNLTENDVGVELNSQLDLTGLETALPTPLQKEFGESWQLGITLNGNSDLLHLAATIDDRLNWESDWQPGANGWQQARLILGQVSTDTLTDTFRGFAVNAHLPHADIGQWYRVLYAFSEEGQAQTKSTDASGWLPDSITIETPQLQWGEQQFHHADIQVWPEDDRWLARVDADNAVLNATIPERFVQQGISVRADYLALRTDFDLPDSKEKTDVSWLNRVPAIDFFCRSCRLDEHDLGQIELAISPRNDGFTIDTLSIKKGKDTLNLNGVWRYADEQGFTHLSGQLDTDDLGDLLRDYGIETAIRDSEAAIDFDLSWEDHLYRPSWPTFNGDVSWDLGKGYLAEVSDGGARLFSMLSLDSILRKLTLDFRDIFSQGMFFTDLTGSVQIDDGVARTDDAQLLGSAGDMDITGWTNIATEELNYQLTYAPKVTSSLPVILAWMVNPPSGLAALLIDKVLHDAKVISRLRYQVTGTISDPVIEEIERDSRPVDLPELEQNSPDSEAEDEQGAINGAANEQSPGSQG